MAPPILSGSANPDLATGIARALDCELTPCARARFPDGERHVQIQGDLRGEDVYVIQPTAPPGDEHMIELFLLIDACRRSGAQQVTAVVPYFGYARQDRRRHAGEPLSIRVMADLFAATGVDLVVVIDPHSAALEPAFGTTIECATAVPVLASAAAADFPAAAVVVAPDLGAVKLAERYASLLAAPVAIVRKTRVSGTTVHVEEIVGDVADRVPVIVDDMISTGATIAASARALLEAGCRPEFHVVATHGLLVGSAPAVLGELPLRRLLVTDTVAVPPTRAVPVEVVSVAPLIADLIGRLHSNRSLEGLTLYR
jgi:ribose-phosphate pyrophosphokinase